MNRLQTYHQKLKKEDFTEVKSSFLVCDSVGVANMRLYLFDNQLYMSLSAKVGNFLVIQKQLYKIFYAKMTL